MGFKDEAGQLKQQNMLRERDQFTLSYLLMWHSNDK